MLWLLLLLAGGSFGENAATTTAPAGPSSFPALETTTSLEDYVTKNLNLLENELTERITSLIQDVTDKTSTEPTTNRTPSSIFEDVVPNVKSQEVLDGLESKKTELINVPSSPIGPPVPSKSTSRALDVSSDALVDAFVDEARFLANHFVVEVPIYSLANATTEFIKSPRMAFGKSPFLTGFGLGFLAFGLKKLLLPLFIGAQIVKSVLVALFLPTLLGHIGKLVGKGLTSVATQSGSSGGTHDQVAEFDFKDPGGGGGYGDVDTAGSDTMSTWTMPAAPAAAQSNAHATLAALNPGRTPGVSQTAQDRPLDLVSSYLRDYANYLIAYSQGNYYNNPYSYYNNNPWYGYYHDNMNSQTVKFNNRGQQSPPDNSFNVEHENHLDFGSRIKGNMKSNRPNSNKIPAPESPPYHVNSHNNFPKDYYNWKYGNYYSNFKRAQQVQKYTPRLPSYQIKQHYGSFYSKDPQSDFKVFNKIPSSSQLLTHYDPFYSPLLSRLDSVFKQLGTTSEGCRERLVCDMYRNPAKFAPFSNLVSAQLSRELNELRKPSSDNPEILRFFRYMKSAKDGQDGAKCEVLHNACIAPTIIAENASPMVTTFNDINKLVHARKLDK